jgi:hypothetical protein
MFFMVSLIALAIAIAAIFGLQLHSEAVEEMDLVFVLMLFAFPTIAVYGGLTLIVCNLISSWLGWPELSLPWWPQRPRRAAVTISLYFIAGWLGVFIGVIALVWYYARTDRLPDVRAMSACVPTADVSLRRGEPPLRASFLRYLNSRGRELRADCRRTSPE